MRVDAGSERLRDAGSIPATSTKVSGKLNDYSPIYSRNASGLLSFSASVREIIAESA